MKPRIKYKDVRTWIYGNMGRTSRDMDGRICIKNKPVTDRELTHILFQLEEIYEGVNMTGIKSALSPDNFEAKLGPLIPMPDEGWLNGEKHTLYTRHNDYGLYRTFDKWCVRMAKAPDFINKYFKTRSEAVEYFNKQMELNQDSFMLTPYLYQT